MASPQETGEARFIIGREGLKIPVVSSVTSSFSVIGFFKDMWELNNFEFHKDAYGSTIEDWPFKHELVVPGGKSILTVIRGSYTPRNQNDIEYDKRRNEENAEWGRVRPTTLGVETHGVYVPPASLGQFMPLLSVDYPHISGDVGTSLGEPIKIWHRGSAISERQFWDDSNKSILPEEKWKEARKKYNTHLTNVLNTTVEFLS